MAKNETWQQKAKEGERKQTSKRRKETEKKWTGKRIMRQEKKRSKRTRKGRGRAKGNATMERIGCLILLSLFLLIPFLVAIFGIKSGILTVSL